MSCSCIVRRKNNVDSEAHEFSRNRGEPLLLSLRGTEFKFDVLPLHPSQLTQPLPERVEVYVGSGADGHHSDSVHLRSLLRASGQWHRERTGQRSQQEAAAIHYSIT
jgi:hypothetical protein